MRWSAFVEVGDGSGESPVPNISSGDQIIAEKALQEVCKPVPRVTNTMKLDQETDESDEVVWDAHIVWASFANTWPNDAKEKARKPCAKVIARCQATERSRQRTRCQGKKMHDSFLSQYAYPEVPRKVLG